MEDRSLDDFFEPDEGDTSDDSDVADVSDDGGADTLDDEEEASDDSAETSESETETASKERSDIEPAETTSAWTPDGNSCTVCGERANRLWRDDGQAVCRSCKDW